MKGVQMRIAIVIELVGLGLSIIAAVKSYLEFKRRGKEALRLMLGSLLLASGIAVILARRVYFGTLGVIPITYGTVALVGLLLVVVGCFLIVRDWRHGSGIEREKETGKRENA